MNNSDEGSSCLNAGEDDDATDSGLEEKHVIERIKVPCFLYL